MPKQQRSPSQDHIFEHHQIAEATVTPTIGSWLLRRPADGSFWCRITAASGHLMVIGDFDPIIFGHCGSLNPRAIVAWIGECSADDSYYPAQKAEIGMRVRIADRPRSNGIRRDAVFLALAAVRRLHVLLERQAELSAQPSPSTSTPA